jgi:hypothetical protein
MKELFAANHLEKFMLRLDRVAPLANPNTPRTGASGTAAAPFSGEFDLLLAAATLAAHLEFAAHLDPGAAAGEQRRQIEEATHGLRRQTLRFRTALMMFWLSRTLSSSSKSRQEAIEWAGEAYGEALQCGHRLMTLALPCSTGWYDATVDRRQFGGSRPRGTGAPGGRRARV